MAAYYIDMRNIHKRFGGVQALSGVQLQIKKGEVHALVGENGAGKSTLIKVLGGVHHMDTGEIYINDKAVHIANPRDGINHGISIIYQEFALVPDLSVTENIYLDTIEKEQKIVNWKRMRSGARELLDGMGFPDIDEKSIISELTVSYQQIVEIAKAIAKQTKVLVLDEPSSLLSSKEVERLFSVIRNMKQQGISILYVSHKLEEVFEISDRITVLKDGKYVKTVDTSDIDERGLVSLMIGRDMKDYFPKRNSRIGETAFEVKNINRGSKVINVSFSVRSGEVLGLAGLVGAGRTETIRAIIGADKRDSGTVIVNNKEVHIRSPKNAFDHGIGFLSEDRKGEGVLLEMPIRYNTTLSSLKKYLNRIGVIKKKCETEDIKNIVGKLRIKAPSIETVLFNLSGGNQQKVALSRLLMSGCNVFLFDEPTRGVDVGAKREIYMLMNQLAEAGNAIIMVSSETPEILGMCDRVVVMYEGTVTGVVDKEDLSEKHIISYAMGVKEL